MTKALMALAACLLVSLGTWKFSSQESASQVFAAAIENVRLAKSFTCKRIDVTIEDGKKVVRKELFMFKEPNLERRVLLSSRIPQFNGEVTIHNYDSTSASTFGPNRKESICH